MGKILKPLGLGHNGTKGIIDVCKGLPLNGSYWVIPEGFEGNFSQSPELITGGILPKAWRYMEHDGICLYEDGTTGVSNTGWKSYSEYYAETMRPNAVYFDWENWKGITASKLCFVY